MKRYFFHTTLVFFQRMYFSTFILCLFKLQASERAVQKLIVAFPWKLEKEASEIGRAGSTWPRIGRRSLVTVNEKIDIRLHAWQLNY